MVGGVCLTKIVETPICFILKIQLGQIVSNNCYCLPRPKVQSKSNLVVVRRRLIHVYPHRMVASFFGYLAKK